MEVDENISFYEESILLAPNQNNVDVELVDVDLEELPEGPFLPESTYAIESGSPDTSEVDSRDDEMVIAHRNVSGSPDKSEIHSRDEQIEIGHGNASSNGKLH